MAWPNDNTALTPATEADIPYALRYTHPTVSGSPTVEVTSGPYLDILRQTPYGIQQTVNDGSPSDLSLAWNWAWKYQGVSDPSDRNPVGGPRGCFMPVFGGGRIVSGTVEDWEIRNPLYMQGSRWGGSFGGLSSGYADASNNHRVVSRVRVNFDSGTYDNTIPALYVVGGNVDLSGMVFYNSGTKRERAILYTRMSSTSNPYYIDASTTPTSTTSVSDIRMRSMAFGGFERAIQVGATQTEVNNDLLHFEHCDFGDCDIGIHFRNQNTQVNSAFKNKNGTVRYYQEEGGNLMIRGDNLTYADETLLKLGVNVSHGTGKYRIYDTKFDTQTGGTAKLIDFDSFTDFLNIIDIEVIGGHNAYSGTVGFPTNFIECGGNIRLAVRDFKGIGPITCHAVSGSGTYRGKTHRPFVLLDNCGLYRSSSSDASRFEQLVLSGIYDRTIRDCYLNSNSSKGDTTSRPVRVPDTVSTNSWHGLTGSDDKPWQ